MGGSSEAPIQRERIGVRVRSALLPAVAKHAETATFVPQRPALERLQHEGAGAEAAAIRCINVRRLPPLPQQILGLSVALELTWHLGVSP